MMISQKILFRKVKTILALILFISSAACGQKVVFIIADGIPADEIENTSTPEINAIIKKGTYVRSYTGGEKGGYNQSPTISAVGYNNILTGTWANKHNVWDNDIADPNYNYKNIFRLFKEEYPGKKIAVFSSWLDNRTKLVGDGLHKAGNIHVDFHADGYELDTLRFPHDTAGDYMHLIDEEVIKQASGTIRNNAPDLSWIYLEYTDDMGHKYGDGLQMKQAIMMLDKQIGAVRKAIEFREKNYKEKWLLVMTTDHGRSEKDGHDHGGQSDRQRTTWMVSNIHFNNYTQFYQPAIVDILPTIARFMHVSISNEDRKELDGVPLIGKVSLVNPKINFINNKIIDLSWQNIDTSGKVKIWVATTNNYKTGGKDTYQLLAEIPNNLKRADLDVSRMPSDLYKVVLEGKYNSVNIWLPERKTK